MNLSTFFRPPRREPPPIPAAITPTERPAIVEELRRAREQHADAQQRLAAQLADATSDVERARQQLREAARRVAELNVTQLSASGAHDVLDEDTLTTRLAALRSAIPEVEGLLVEARPVETPYELREAAWKRGASA